MREAVRRLYANSNRLCKGRRKPLLGTSRVRGSRGEKKNGPHGRYIPSAQSAFPNEIGALHQHRWRATLLRSRSGVSWNA